MLFHLPSFGRGGARGSHEPVQEYHQDLNESPTTTPFHTRSTTPSQDVPRPHTAVDSRATVAGLLSVLGERHGHAEVGVVDGSAIVPALIKLKYLGLYFALNLGLTFFNKIIMSKVQFGANCFAGVLCFDVLLKMFQIMVFMSTTRRLVTYMHSMSRRLVLYF